MQPGAFSPVFRAAKEFRGVQSRKIEKPLAFRREKRGNSVKGPPINIHNRFLRCFFFGAGAPISQSGETNLGNNSRAAGAPFGASRKYMAYLITLKNLFGGCFSDYLAGRASKDSPPGAPLKPIKSPTKVACLNWSSGGLKLPPPNNRVRYGGCDWLSGLGMVAGVFGESFEFLPSSGDFWRIFLVGCTKICKVVNIV